MPIQIDSVSIIWALGLLAELAIVWRIGQADLGRTFTWFRVFLIASSIASIVLMIARYGVQNRNLYGYLYVGWTYLATIFWFFALRELTTVALSPFPAIQTASRKTLLWFWVSVAIIGVCWFSYLSSQGPTKSPILRDAIHYEESASIGFAIFVFLFLSFLAWMPVPLTRNQLSHCFLMGALFLFAAFSRFLTEFGDFANKVEVASYVGITGSLLVSLVWLARIRPGADDTLTTPKGKLDRAEAERMLARLEDLNRSLARTRPHS